MSEPSFAELVERLQHDDRAALSLVIERYGNALRRAIERALWVGRLDGSGSGTNHDPIAAEASDIFQTVILLFLSRLRRHREGTSEALWFETPGHLVAYLKAIAEHEMARQQRRRVCQTVSKRALTGFDQSAGHEPASREPTPSQSLLARELLERDRTALAEVARRWSPDERAIWDLVRQELSWPEIARRLGGTASPEAVRKTFARAVRRTADELKAQGNGNDHDQVDPERPGP
jgi:hypothetical protein